MSQSLSKVLLHIVFSTKGRAPFILPNHANELHAFVAGACSKVGCHPFRVGGTEDHLHIACALSRTISIADLVREAKVSSSLWVKQRSPLMQDFAWQTGYGAFSIGQSQLPTLIRYIERQAEHHAGQSYQDEFRDLSRLYDVELDERFAWE